MFILYGMSSHRLLFIKFRFFMVRSCSGNIFHKFIDLINAFRSIHTESFGIQASVFIDLNNNFFFIHYSALTSTS